MEDFRYLSQGERLNGGYITIPRELYTLGLYSELSNDAILLYGILLNRFKLSSRNAMKDKVGQVFVMASIENIMKMLKVSKGKARKVLKELVDLLLLKIEKMECFNSKRRLYLGAIRKENDVLSGDKICPYQGSNNEPTKGQNLNPINNNINKHYLKSNESKGEKSLVYSYLKEFDFED
ncbi:replication initiator protein A [Clostridium gasigenes]|uniref:replication initiator protein A n=1 Tax=Clostridium gasigenes TaxID=94869 RepID=UPI001C0DE2A4|nr:replication initiator protein A [Clostridium gasigenes]MBU3089130.1 replication initiator protein A [Clostridium gasigenes]